jgi:hypothetical protein
MDMFCVTDEVEEAVEVMAEAAHRRRSPAPGAGEKPDEPRRPD